MDRDAANCRGGDSGQRALRPDAGVWQRLRVATEAETGMDFSEGRLQRLCDAAKKVLAQHWPPTAKLEKLLDSPREQGLLLEQLSAQLTIGETFFFRNEHHFRALREHVIPAILERNADSRQIRVWCAGCATGEEPYSVAILLDQMLRDAGLPSWQISILATDLNPEFLERGREGFYRPWSFRQTDIQHDRTYFSPEADGFRLSPHVGKHVRFAYLNLVKDVYPSPLTGTLGLDLILFRNVAIYLKPEVTAAILTRFHQSLRVGGWLLLGETEVSLAPAEHFQVRRFEQATLFHREDKVVAGDLACSSPAPVLTPSSPGSPSSSFAPVASHGPSAGPVQPPTAPFKQNRRAETPSAEVSSWDHLRHFVATRDFDNAERALNRIIVTKQRARLRLQYVRALLAVAEHGRARRMLDVCLKEQPLLLEAQLLDASLAEDIQDLDAAERAYRRALFIDRNCPITHFHLGLVLIQKGDRSSAKRSFQTTLKLIAGREDEAFLDCGEGMCCGRLREMVNLLLTKWDGNS